MTETQKKGNIYFITSCGIITALICILAPNSIPIGTIPISLTNLILYFSIYILGWKGSTISYIVYILLGLVGLPVFSGYQGGPAKIVGPTGGYLLGFVIITIVSGLCFELSKKEFRIPLTIAGMIVSTAVTYLLGTLWFMNQTQMGFNESLTVCVYPFIPFDLVKIAIATLIGMPVRAALIKAGMITVKKK